jgi:hypothetical protein
MNKKFQTVYKRFKQLVNIGTVAAVTFLISFLYPNNVKFKYEFHRGQAWPYEDLTAPFDFAIKKTNLELEKDRALIMREFWPYYNLNSDLAGLGGIVSRLVERPLLQPTCGAFFRSGTERKPNVA